MYNTIWFKVQVSLTRLKLDKKKDKKSDRETPSPTVQKQTAIGQLTTAAQQQMMTAISSGGGGGKRVPIYHNAHKMFQVFFLIHCLWFIFQENILWPNHTAISYLGWLVFNFIICWRTFLSGTKTALSSFEIFKS